MIERRDGIRVRPATIAVLVIAALACIPLAGAWSQTTKANDDGVEARYEKLMERSEQLVGEIRAMATQVNDLDIIMDERVAAMHAASEADRLAATQVVVEELIAQRGPMRTAMKATHQKLMIHMMEILTLEDAGLRERAMAESPLMKMIMAPRYGSGPSSTPYGELDR
jgi:hypothetical protein